MTMISRPAELTPAILNKAVGRYYKELQDYAGQAEHELALRPAFQNLLAEMARRINLTLVHEMTIRGRIRPDGVLCNTFNIRLGYWEAKGPKANWEWGIRIRSKRVTRWRTRCSRTPDRPSSTKRGSAITLTYRSRRM